MEACPYDAISVKDQKLVVDLKKCDGCRLCAALCGQGAVEFFKRVNPENLRSSASNKK
jgi:Fe-S-cluster-containing hydrogenase component 2